MLFINALSKYHCKQSAKSLDIIICSILWKYGNYVKISFFIIDTLWLDCSSEHPGHSLNFMRCHLRSFLNSFEGVLIYSWHACYLLAAFPSLSGPTHPFPISDQKLFKIMGNKFSQQSPNFSLVVCSYLFCTCVFFCVQKINLFLTSSGACLDLEVSTAIIVRFYFNLYYFCIYKCFKSKRCQNNLKGQ